MSDFVLSWEAFIKKIHFLYSLVPGSADDSGTSQRAVRLSWCLLATQQRAWLGRDLAETILSVTWRASPTLRSEV